MTGKKAVFVAFVMVFVGLVVVGWKLTSRTSYESAAYDVIESDGPFEIREYPDLMLVTTGMKSRGSDGSFGRLFAYITGRNESDVNVAMTTPVFMEPESSEAGGQMGFVVPAMVASAEIPNPTDVAVQIQKRDGGRFAVFQFAGQMDESTMAINEVKLREWIAARGLSSTDGLEFAGYDPPWTPNPFRRNEILIRLK